MKNSKSYLYILLFLFISSCNLPTYVLLDGITEVPQDPEVYKNKSKFDISLLNQVDTNVVYEAFDTYRNKPERLTDASDCCYSVYRFYSNGCFNVFIFDKDSLEKEILDPLYEGIRGIYYSENEKIKFDVFAPANQLRTIGKLTGTFSFSNDTLYETMDFNVPVQVYVKKSIPREYMVYKPDW